MKCPQIWKAPACVTFIIGALVSAFAQAQDADWKFYGGKMQFCFYDKNTMTPIPRGYDVKIKCIDPDEMGGVEIQKHAWFVMINCTRRMARLEPLPPGGVLPPGALGGHLRRNNVGADLRGHYWWDDVSSVEGTSEAALMKAVCEP